MQEFDRFYVRLVLVAVLVVIWLNAFPFLFTSVVNELNALPTTPRPLTPEAEPHLLTSPIAALASAFSEMLGELVTGITSLLTSSIPNLAVWLLSIMGIIVLLAVLGAFTSAAAIRVSQYRRTRRTHAEHHAKAAQLITSLPDRDMLVAEVGLHCLDLPSHKAQELQQTAELLAIKLGSASAAYHRFMNASTRHSAKWQTTKRYKAQINQLGPILKELQTHEAAWKLLDTEMTNTRRGMAHEQLNERLLVLEIGLRNAGKILPTKSPRRFKSDRIKQHHKLTAQTALLRKQLNESPQSRWEIHVGLQDIEDKARVFSPTQFAAISTDLTPTM